MNGEDSTRTADVVARLDALRARVLGSECPEGRRPVPWEGDSSARLALVGEAPGDTEERQGRPFVGQSGRLLERELATAGIDRAALWITNVVKCRPTREEGGRVANRAPTTAEVRAWLPLLEEELAILRPAVILCLGAVAAKALIRADFAMTRERGQWSDTPSAPRIPSLHAIAATYHPSYLLRLQGSARDTALDQFRADLREAWSRARQATEE
jgi:DNA polymerase